MSWFLNDLRETWLAMLQPPWRHSGPNDNFERVAHWIVWLLGWAWMLAGLVLGALLAPSLVQAVGLANTSYQDGLVIAAAVVAGLLVQLSGWGLFVLWGAVTTPRCSGDKGLFWSLLGIPAVIVFALLPLVAVGYGIYRYLNWVGADQRSVTLAFVGSFLIKTFIIPAIVGAVRSQAFKLLMRWLRGENTKKNA